MQDFVSVPAEWAKWSLAGKKETVAFWNNWSGRRSLLIFDGKTGNVVLRSYGAYTNPKDASPRFGFAVKVNRGKKNQFDSCAGSIPFSSAISGCGTVECC